MSKYETRLADLVRRDPRYTYEAYEFVLEALSHTQQVLGREAEDAGHISGREWVEGIRDLAVREFGLLARVVFRLWGINRTADFGEIVFNLVEARLLDKADQESREDFHDLFDLDQALVQEFRIQSDEAEWTR